MDGEAVLAVECPDDIGRRGRFRTSDEEGPPRWNFSTTLLFLGSG